jgi:hypothetical protein
MPEGTVATLMACCHIDALDILRGLLNLVCTGIDATIPRDENSNQEA